MKKIFIVSVVGAVIIGLVATILIFRVKTEPNENLQNPVTGSSYDDVVNNQTKAEPIQGKGSLNTILALAEDLECTIDYTASTSQSAVTGTYFTSNGKLRGDFVIPNVDGEIVSSMIMADDVLYNWSKIDGQSYGMKMAVDENEEIRNGANIPESHEAVPLGASVNYNCRSWTVVDNSIFEPPTDILFKEYDTAVKSGMEYGTVYEESSTTKSACALCEQVPDGEGKDQCKLNFNCAQ